MKILNNRKESIYLIIPSACITFWTRCYFLKISYSVPWNNYLDFGFFCDASQQVLIDPSKIYEINEFYYIPIAAVFFVFTNAPFLLYIIIYQIIILMSSFQYFLLLPKILSKFI